MLAEEISKSLIAAQKCEITEHIIYKKLAETTGDSHNREILLSISQDELRHYNFWKQFTSREVKPNWLKVWTYYFVSKILGLTFGIKLMEKGEGRAQVIYTDIAKNIPAVLDIVEEEDKHEDELIQMINEERLNYIGSIILGLNDALVELSGALAGLTLALQNSRLVAMAGLITGIAASLSMGSTGYLASKSEGSGKAPLKSALYTGITYIFTVLFLTFPYLLLTNVVIALAVMIFNVVIIILVFNFYISVAKNLPFGKRFSEMALLSLGIAAVSFGIGFLVRELLGVEI
jgi:VIT1/CCC1 family predicted Fe2+/Mn2+ transporter